MKTLLCICGIVLSLACASCKESPTNSGSNLDGVYETSLFVNGTSNILVPLNESIDVDAFPTIEQFDDPYVYCYLTWWSESSKSIAICFQGRQLTPGPIMRTIILKINGETIEVPVKINVIDFFYASHPFTNAPDTLVLQKGTNFLLKIGFKDSAGNTIPNSMIRSKVSGGYCNVNSISGEKVICQNYWRDTTYFSFMLSAFSDITPSPNDAGMNFTFTISNRSVVVPIKLTY